MSYLKDFKTVIDNHDYPAFLKLWEEYCAGDELDGEEVCQILKLVKTSSIAESVGRHVEKILPLWQLMPEGPSSHEVLKLIVDVAITNNDALATLSYEQLKKLYGNDDHFVEKIRLIGLRGKEKFQGAISNYELLSHMKKGNYVFHTGGWGVGEIFDCSLMREQLTVEFDYVPGKKEISFSTAFKSLLPIPHDHFLALRFGSPDVLEAQARENPVEVIHKLLRDLGPKTASEIKEELCELVIPTEEWPRWWQNARNKLKKDTLIATPEDIREPFSLRSQELSHENRLKQLLEKRLSTAALIQTLYSFLRDFPEILKNIEFKNTLAARITEILSHKETTSAERLEILFLLEDFCPSKETEEISSLIEQCESIQKLLASTEVLGFKKRVLLAVRKHRRDWKTLFLSLFFEVDQGALRDYILAEVLGAKMEAEIKEKLKDLYAHPERHPEAFLWYFQKLQTQKVLPLNDKSGKMRFFEGLLILLSHIENKPEERERVKKIHALLSDERFALVRHMLQNASLEEVKECLLLATKCNSLSDHDQKIFHSLAEVVYPELVKVRKKHPSSHETETPPLWTTQAGLDKTQQKMQRIATLDTVENAKEIEVARAHGDLRENAEFKAALERRDRLQGELKLFSDQVKQARVITQQDISTNEVSIGSVVECVNPQGKTVCYTLLGPWDADTDKHIISFQSKLAQTLKGKQVGATFPLQGEEWTITSIRSFLE